MKEKIQSIRILIRDDKIKEAITSFERFIPSHYENDLILLSASFNNWEKNNRLGMTSPIEQRNKSIYGILELISEVELKYVDDNNERVTKFKQKIETNLKQGNDLLHQINNNNLSKEELLQKLYSLSDNPDDVKETILDKGEIEAIIRKSIKKNEKIYRLLKFSVILNLASILSPIIWSNLDIIEDIIKSIEESDDSDDDEDDIDIE